MIGKAMDDVELIKEKINIVDLISEYLPLKKSGANFKTNCPFHNEKTASFVVSPERQIWHCFGCFPPGELIKTPFGYHPVETVTEGEYVVSGTGSYQKVLATHTRVYEGDLINLYTRKIRRWVSLTGDHQVFAIRSTSKHEVKYKYFAKRYRKYLKYLSSNPEYYFRKIEKWLPIQEFEARSLKVGDLLLYPLNERVSPVLTLDLNKYVTNHSRLGPQPTILPMVKVNEDFLKLIGYWIAEGSNNRAYIRFSLGNHEEDFAEDIVELVKKIFNIKASIYHRPSENKTGIEVTACSAFLANAFENLCGKGAENKHIPFVLQEIPSDLQKVLLDAIHKGDGISYKASKSSKIHKSITTVSKILSEQIIDILLRLDIFPSLSVDKKHQDHKGVNHRESYTMIWSEEARLKYDLVYYSREGLKYWLLPITELKSESYKGSVHNLTVNEDHSYIASHFAVSNCGKGGDSFSFLMEKEGMEFKEALEMLAKKAGVVLKRTPDQKDFRDRLFEVNLKAQEFYHYILTKHSLGKAALEYLKKRGVSDESIKNFGIGYAPNSWESLTKFLLKRGFSVAEIIAAGLGVASKNGCYDRFRGRITFPLIDGKDNLRGFSGRVLSPAEPKYINSPQTPIFDKSNYLFGMNLAKGEIREKKMAVLVEGEMDVVLSHQAGFKQVVASKGTALTEGQIELIKKYTQDLSLCFDMDLAGDSASRRGIELADKAGLNIKVVQIEGGKDAAEVVLEDPKIWQKAIEEAVPIYDYYLTSIAKRYDSKSPSDLKKIGEELIPVWAKITDDLVRERYIQKLSAYLRTDDKMIREKVAKARMPQSGNYTQVFQKATSSDNIVAGKTRRELLEEYLVALLLHPPLDFIFVPNFPETLFLKESFRQIYVMLVLYLDTISFKSKAFNINEFAQNLPKELLAEVDRLYLTELDSKLLESKNWQKELEGVVSELKKALIKASLEKLSLEIKNAQEFGKMEIVETLNKRFRDLSVKLKNL